MAETDDHDEKFSTTSSFSPMRDFGRLKDQGLSHSEPKLNKVLAGSVQSLASMPNSTIRILPSG